MARFKLAWTRGQRPGEKGSEPCPEKGYRILVRGNEIRSFVSRMRGNDRNKTFLATERKPTDFCASSRAASSLSGSVTNRLEGWFVDETILPRLGKRRLVSVSPQRMGFSERSRSCETVLYENEIAFF